VARFGENFSQPGLAAGQGLEPLGALLLTFAQRLEGFDCTAGSLLALVELPQPPLDVAEPVIGPSFGDTERGTSFFFVGEFPVIFQRLLQEVALQGLEIRLLGNPVLRCFQARRASRSKGPGRRARIG
jgi:hypothetical protein